MPQNKWIYLDEAGLQEYDSLIKSYIDTEDAKAIKYITFVPVATGNPETATNPTEIRFWKVDPTSAGASPAYVVTLPDASTLMTKITGGTLGNLTTVGANGQVVDSGIASTIVVKKSDDSGATFTAGQWAVFDADGDIKGLAANASNVAFDDSTAHTGSNTIQGAIDSIAQATGGGVAAKTVYITETSGGSSDLYSKRYGVYQGSEGSAASPLPSELLANIDIPKDMVVEEGSVVDIVFDDSNNSLHEGSISGPDVTAAIKGAGTPATSADAGKYIKLVIANSTSTALYIKATDLVDVYTGGTSADGTISISASNVITFTLSAAHITSLGKADTSLQPISSATEDNIVTFNANGGIKDSGVSINDVTQGLEEVIAPAFSTSATYALGDYVMYNSKLYECTTAVTTAGAWNPANWTESKVMTSFAPIPSSFIQGLFS